MGNCISGPKNSEKGHHAKGKPTTNHVVAVSLYFTTLELTRIKRCLKLVSGCASVPKGLSSTGSQPAEGVGSQEAVGRQLSMYQQLFVLQKPAVAGAAGRAGGHAGGKKQGIAHSVLGKQTEVCIALATPASQKVN